MKKIINKSKNGLLFPKFDLYVGANQIKIITDDVFSEVISNSNIQEYIEVEKEEIKEEEVKKEIKENVIEKRSKKTITLEDISEKEIKL
jgi:hypothetical protein